MENGLGMSMIFLKNLISDRYKNVFGIGINLAIISDWGVFIIVTKR